VIQDFRDHRLDELARLVRTRRVSAEELVGLALRTIEELNAPLNAWAALDSERAVADARAIDERIAAGDDIGPLAGIPIGVKDLEDATGFRTGFGSSLHAVDPAATSDSILVSRLPSGVRRRREDDHPRTRVDRRHAEPALGRHPRPRRERGRCTR
jgi:Asp-tRNA(Asn)/Glu-tRNA(Gln) amidotransferase A subunit family amidase